MQHKAEGCRQHQIKGPGNETPVKQRKYPRPRLHGAQLCDMGIGGIHDPLGEGIEQNIRRQTAGEHHAAPSEEGVLRLFLGASQHDIAVFGSTQVYGHKENAQPRHNVEGSQRVAEKEPHLSQHKVRLLRQREKQQTQPANQRQGHQCDHPVDSVFPYFHGISSSFPV